MAQMLPYVQEMINKRDTNKVLATSSLSGDPHAIVCSTLEAVDADTLIVAELKMHRTGKNLEENPQGEFMIWRGRQSYFIKVRVNSRVTSGPHYDKCKKFLDELNIPMFAVWIFDVISVNG